MLRFSLASLLVFVLIAAIGSAALASPSDLWRQTIFTLTVSILLLATLAAFISGSTARSFAGGFALAGWLYLMLSFVGVLGLREHLLTHEGIQWLGRTIHGHDEVARSVWMPVYDVDTKGTLDLSFSLTSAIGTFPQQTSPLSNLTAIGHALWTVIVGWLGGVVALWLRRRGRRAKDGGDER